MSEGRIPLVLVPGMLCDARQYGPQTEALRDIADMTVAGTLDAPDISGLARNILRGAPARFALAGTSMGGYIALEILQQAPERVQKLALLDTSARADRPEDTRNREATIRMARAGRFAEVVEHVIAHLMRRDRPVAPDVADVIRAMAHDAGAAAYEQQVRAVMARPDRRAGLAGIGCPTLVLCGREDGLTRLSHSEEMAALIPGARLVVIEGAGHLPMLERPEAVNAALREWLLAEGEGS